MKQLIIDEKQCTRCGACSASCPLSIIDTKEDQTPFLSAEKSPYCINCFHCEAVCPTQAIVHSLSNKGLVSSIQSDRAISANDLSSYMQRRRSIRQFKTQKIEQQVLEQAMEAVRYAPTGTNRQMNHWIMISDDSMIQQLAQGTIDWMGHVVTSMPEMAGRYNFPAIIASWNAGIDRICRHAPHLAISYTPSAHPIGPKDAVIATSHLELFLPSLGIGSCWAGFLMIAIEQNPAMKQLIGLTKEETVHAILMMGYPKYKYKNIPARNTSNIKWL